MTITKITCWNLCPKDRFSYKTAWLFINPGLRWFPHVLSSEIYLMIIRRIIDTVMNHVQDFVENQEN